MNAAGKILRQTVPVLFLCTLFELFSGGILESMKEKFVLLPGLLVMIPPLVDLRGNIGSALASRLGTALHLGIVKPKLAMTRALKTNILSSLILSVLGSITVWLLSCFLCLLMDLQGVSLLCLLFIATFSAVVSGILITFTTVLLSIISYRRGWDPDNITGPVMTTLGDIFTFFSILLAVVIW